MRLHWRQRYATWLVHGRRTFGSRVASFSASLSTARASLWGIKDSFPGTTHDSGRFHSLRDVQPSEKFAPRMVDFATLYVGGESQTGIGQSELQETGGEGVPGEVGGGGGSGGDGKGVRGGEEAEVEREGEREEEREDVPIPNSQGMRKKQKQKKQVGKEQNKPGQVQQLMRIPCNYF